MGKTPAEAVKWLELGKGKKQPCWLLITTNFKEGEKKRFPEVRKEN